MSSETFLAALRGYVQEILAKGDLFKSILTLNPQGTTAKEIISINTKGPTGSPINIEKLRQDITTYLKELKAKAQAQASASKPPANPIDKLKDNLKFMDEYGALSYVSHMLMLALVYLDIRQDNAADLNASKRSSALTNQALAGLDAEVKRLEANTSAKNAELTTLKQELKRLELNASAKNAELMMLRESVSAKNTDASNKEKELTTLKQELEKLRGNANAKNTEQVANLKKQIEEAKAAKVSLEEASTSLRDEITKIKAENEKLNRFKTTYDKLTALMPNSALKLRAF